MRDMAKFGLLAWGAYAAAEAGLLVLRPLAAGHQQMVLSSHWELLAICTVVYLIAGATFGALAGWAAAKLRLCSRGIEARWAILTLLMAYFANLAVGWSSWDATSSVALVLGLFLLAAVTAGLVRPRWTRLTRPFADPWLVAILLVGGPLLAPIFNPWKILAISVAAAAAFLLSATLLDRGAGGSGFPRRQALALVVVLAGIFLSIPVFVEPLAVPQPPAAPRTRAGRPNVVLLVMDTVRADHLSVYGYQRDTTPGLRRMARQATLYRHCLASSNCTLTSHASIFTALYPRSHGAINSPPGISLGEPLDARLETLAERLAAEGYFNVAVVANFGYLRPEFGLDQGFHVYDARQPVPCLPPGKSHPLRYGLRAILRRLASSDKFDQKYRDAAEINDTVFALLDSAVRTATPFFLFVNYMDAHAPYTPPAPYNHMFGGRDGRLTPEHFRELHDAVARGERRISEAERRHYVSQYDGAIAYLDAQIERLAEWFKHWKAFENTVWIVTSDHGEAFGEHGHIGHGWSLYQEETHVPLIIKYPGQQAAASFEASVGLVDIMPTVLAALRMAASPGWHGVDLSSSEAAANTRSVFAEAYLSGGRILNDRVKYPLTTWALLSPEYLKLISASDGRQELYDLTADPAETSNLRAGRRPDSDRLLAELEAWKERHPIRASARRAPSPSTLERLKALGYLR
jgi:arylsulfatase A-like enzyme